MKCKKRRLNIEFESYIKTDGGREKIKAWDWKVVGQLLKQGTLSEIENYPNEMGGPVERECVW